MIMASLIIVTGLMPWTDPPKHNFPAGNEVVGRNLDYKRQCIISIHCSDFETEEGTITCSRDLSLQEIIHPFCTRGAQHKTEIITAIIANANSAWF